MRKYPDLLHLGACPQSPAGTLARQIKASLTEDPAAGSNCFDLGRMIDKNCL